MKTTARTGSKDIAEDTEGSAVSVQVLSVLIDISSSCFLKKYGEFIAKENL
jgi:hypothetical protein